MATAACCLELTSSYVIRSKGDKGSSRGRDRATGRCGSRFRNSSKARTRRSSRRCMYSETLRGTSVA